MAKILCIDTEPSTAGSLREVGHDVDTSETGIRSGFPSFLTPPQEVDLILCDLRKPACFDALHWGPGKNDNYRCTIVKEPTDAVYYKDGRPCPRYVIIQESQLRHSSFPTAFGSTDVLKAVDRAGVPVLLFLNPEWIRHVSIASQSIVGIRWQFVRTAARIVHAPESLADVVHKLVGSISFRLPIEFAIDGEPTLVTTNQEALSCQATTLVTNSVGQVFGQIIQMTKGRIWAIPGCEDNLQVTKIFLSHLAELRDSPLARSVRLRSKDLMRRDMKEKPMDPKIFVSYSTKDRPFVERLVADLKGKGVNVWFDYAELQIGDSIVEGISKGLKTAAYMIIVLSKSSVESRWVQSEMSFALMESLSGKGVAILPVLIEDCDIPPLLKDRVYADFRRDYQAGMEKLANVIAWEAGSLRSITGRGLGTVIESAGPHPPDCLSELSRLELGELRRRLTQRLNRPEVATIWYDTLETLMDNDMSGRTLAECVFTLIDRAKSRSRLDKLIRNICHERPDVHDP